MNLLIFLLIILEIICNVAAQIALKVGMGRIGEFSFSGSSILPIGLQVITSPWIIVGIFIYIISLIIWLMVLSRVEVSIVYPMTSLAYALTILIAYFFLGEHITVMRVVGVLVIMCGVFLVARSGT